MKRVYALLIISMFSIAVFAQASGGQIIRKGTNTTTTNSTQKKTNTKAPNSTSKEKNKKSSKYKNSNESPMSSRNRSYSADTKVKAHERPASHGDVVKISEPDGYKNGYGYVDLGLPSRTKWAICNIGAKSPEQYGDYFAWGETTGYNSGKTDFSWITYKWGNGSNGSLTKYNTEDNNTVLYPEDDAAYAIWGSNWCMPTIEQFEELINSTYTTTMWTELKGVFGYKITSKKNGKSIFLPAAGYRNGSSINSAGSYGSCWSRTLNPSGLDFARGLYFGSSSVSTSYFGRCGGRSVRPVCRKIIYDSIL